MDSKKRLNTGRLGPRKLWLAGEEFEAQCCPSEFETVPDGRRGLSCDTILANLFQQHPELHRALLLILEDERCRDNEFLRQEVIPYL